MSYINRELSWLEFNQRVLDEALLPDLPLLERLKFLAITASNMDEFFQVRVGGLHLMRTSGARKRGITGMTPNQQLKAIRERAQTMIEDQYQLFNKQLLPAMAEEGLLLSHSRAITPEQHKTLASRFEEAIAPLLTPLAYTPETPPPFLPALRIIVAFELETPDQEAPRIVFIPVPESLPRFYHIPASQTNSQASEEHLILVEEIIALFAGELFPDEKIISSMPFRITRNGDIAVQEEDAIDLAGEMEEVLAARITSNTVRLELPHRTPARLQSAVRKILQAGTSECYRIPGPLALTDFMSVAFASGFDHLRDEPWEPQPSAQIDPGASIFDVLAERDILLNHPYESFEPVLRFLEEAAADPSTIAIKQVLYRTASQSRIIDALIKAAENGKQVTVLIELKARFDEARNLMRADELQRAGVQIVYGVKGLKTHAKIALVIRNEDGQLKRYVHLGSGNYNESTAKLYTDISYMTSKPAYGADASLIFNAVTGRSKLTRFAKLVPAPTHMKPRLLDLIAAEAKRAKQGEPASITAKVNSLQDKEIIDALYQASRDGVKIRLNIRGLCCLRTGKRKESKNIRVVSVIDRYLEHARIFSFHHGGQPLVYIASADWMTRNLDKRVELMIPIEDKTSRKRLLGILEAAFKDNCNAHEILQDGTSKRIERTKGKKRFRLQEYLQQQAKTAARASAHERSTTFEPHTPPS
ncbi:polyphosphate kinase 1 [Verrucomicrobiaceae bacterium N1E253]|uniref:Polyphosphate kinase n=1 Tax=Oceaniferula marina TaxID=2748318 RepID=A0A851GI80_9BACT|nr:polyphosphate kinase 1 [Oceaniferula marina]NWK54837.1 polyphosphate kinase 1 [Oceaniferula marina]